VSKESRIDSFYLLYLLNTPIVQKQIVKYTFIQGTISTVGERFNELRLPIHKDENKIKEISDEIKSIIDTKRTLRERIDNLIKGY
jgi:type I restriction enzyme M protein